VSDAAAGLINSAVVGVDYSLDVAAPPEPEPKAAAVSQSFDPGEHTVAEVQEYLAAHPDQADAVLAAEAAGKARTTLVGD
jgi:hypothetical protein